MAAAQSARDQLLTRQPDNIYSQVVTILWDSCLRDGHLRTARQAVRAFAAQQPQTADVLADYGYGNPTFTPEEVCPTTLF